MMTAILSFRIRPFTTSAVRRITSIFRIGMAFLAWNRPRRWHPYSRSGNKTRLSFSVVNRPVSFYRNRIADTGFCTLANCAFMVISSGSPPMGISWNSNIITTAREHIKEDEGKPLCHVFRQRQHITVRLFYDVLLLIFSKAAPSYQRHADSYRVLCTLAGGFIKAYNDYLSVRWDGHGLSSHRNCTLFCRLCQMVAS